MDARLFAAMMADPSVTDLKKLRYKYPEADVGEFVQLLRETAYTPLPLRDFKGNPVVYLDGVTRVQMKALKVLLQPRQNGGFGLHAMEDEIAATLEIEGVDTSRESVRRILRGYAPKNEQESRIYGLKQGLEFISDPVHKITEENLSLLYQMTVGDFLDEEDRLLPGQRYRHDAVYVVGQNVEHTGLPHQKLPEYMARLAEFAQEDTQINDLVKGAVLHFYMVYLHPYFDGNGRMARLLHLWYLVQSGYPSALFVSFSSLIEGSRRGYYQAYTLCESNQTISGVLDVTPFLSYFIQNVYDKLEGYLPVQQSVERFQAALASGTVTEKEQKLWNYVLSAYGTEPFSTKQLEKDYGDAAYATVRSFVRKFQELGLLDGQAYRNRVKYWVK